VKAFVVAKNVPLLEPGGMVSEAAKLRLVEFVLRPTIPPPDPLRVTVQEVDDSGPRLPGLQAIAAMPEIESGTTRVSMAALEEPFSVPVTVTL
jgi:hypothetical protein